MSLRAGDDRGGRSHLAGHFHKSPEQLSPAELRSWLIHLSEDKQLAVSSIAVAAGAA